MKPDCLLDACAMLALLDGGKWFSERVRSMLAGIIGLMFIGMEA